jgi:hypothetical protein
MSRESRAVRRLRSGVRVRHQTVIATSQSLLAHYNDWNFWPVQVCLIRSRQPEIS